MGEMLEGLFMFSQFKNTMFLNFFFVYEWFDWLYFCSSHVCLVLICGSHDYPRDWLW